MGSYVKTKSGNSLYVEDIHGVQGTIIAAHGLTGTHKQLHYYKEVFGGDYRFISYDLRGRGNSDPASPNTSIFSHATDLIELIEELDVENPILMGYSMGAYICALAAANLPRVSSLILLDGAGDADEVSRELMLQSLNRIAKEYSSTDMYVDETRRLYKNFNIEWDETIHSISRYDIQKAQNGNWQHKSNVSALKKDIESFYSFNPMETSASLSCSILLVIATGSIGDKRSLFTEEMYHRIQHSSSDLHTIKTRINHYELVFNRQPDDFYQRIRSFLSP
ncbi:alpha/beta fold hydrolase [Alteribacillus iranensis]|uniref:Pimeloyl-ACP methyl ester carboxylesterase n=1 Tax=Alteribacillus iranensis TaxID=930128 RepID=A0A1I2B8U5_9BACI|nr:alpha/beta hydrolase [Alteribacillus iranensis]SFE52496.1 Pimeloyl-ACP methyl ester carboxylesterase [Alteribacillus iranensis]